MEAPFLELGRPFSGNRREKQRGTRNLEAEEVEEAKEVEEEGRGKGTAGGRRCAPSFM